MEKNKDDGLLLAHLNDLAKASGQKDRPVFSDFTDPVRAEKFVKHFNAGNGNDGGFQSDVTAWGGYEEAERKMLGFFPRGGVSDKENGEQSGGEIDLERRSAFPIDILQISFNGKFNSPPSHRDYLGSLLGLGIEREKTGDIRISVNGALAYVSSDISGYILSGLEKVGRTPVRITRLDASANADAIAGINNGREARVTVASLRLDAVVAAAFRLPRGKAAALIESEKVFVNWTLAASGSKNIKSGDVVTVRGFGRVQLEDATGRTKKDRIVLICNRFG